jgi:hypothetical protein
MVVAGVSAWGLLDPEAVESGARLMMGSLRLRNWCFVRRFSRSQGAVREYLTGDVYDDPRRPDGTRIVTTAIVSHDDHEAVTSSGTRYLLEGDPAPGDASDGGEDLTHVMG